MRTTTEREKREDRIPHTVALPDQDTHFEKEDTILALVPQSREEEVKKIFFPS